jgi:hypothetical protein
MTIELKDFRDRLRERAGLEGTDLTEAELSHLAESYPTCVGKDPWDVREYARFATIGAREYRVVRGHGVRDVFRSVERARATAVQAALNDLESQQDQGRTV